MRSMRQDTMLTMLPSIYGTATYIECEPRVCSTKQHFAVLPLGKICHKVSTACFRCLDALDDGIGIDNKFPGAQHIVNILRGLPDVAFDIHGKARCFRNCQAEVQCDYAGNTTQTNEQAPHVVDVVELEGRVLQKEGFVSSNDDVRHQGSSWKGFL